MTNKYEIGDRVRIVSSRVNRMNPYGEMDKYLDTVMTIDNAVGMGYIMLEDDGRWCWHDNMIVGLENDDKNTMTADELEKRGFKTGDIILQESKVHNGHDGWAIIREGFINSLNTEIAGSWNEVEGRSSNLDVKYILPVEANIRFQSNLSKFLHDFNMDHIEDYLIKIVPSIPHKYIKAVHFGNAKEYTWRIPRNLEDRDIKIGDVVSVDTIQGIQYVEVKDVFEQRYIKSSKCVLGKML